MMNYNDNLLKKIVNNLLTSKCEIDPMSTKYEALIKMLIVFETHHNNKLENIIKESLIKRKIEIKESVKSQLQKMYSKERNNRLLYEIAKDVYKLSSKDDDELEEVIENPTMEMNWECYINREDLKKYLYYKYGQEKLDARREMIRKKSENMKAIIKEKSDRKEEMEKERKQIILDLLDRNCLYYCNGLYKIDNYIEYGGELKPEVFIKEAHTVNRRIRKKEIRKEDIKERLKECNCKDYMDCYIVKNYINGYSTTLIDHLVEDVKELKYLSNNTDYYKIRKNRGNGVFGYYDRVLLREVILRTYKRFDNSDDDKFKTLAVEKFYEKVGEENMGEMPEKIKLRLEEVKKNYEQHKNLEVTLNEERKKKKEELMKKMKEDKKHNIKN